MSTKFWKTPPPWLHMTEGLLPGQGRRVGDSLKVSYNGYAYHLFDFREKISEVYEPVLTLQERLEMLAQAKVAATAAQASTAPPGTCTAHPRDWPADARVWFYDSHMNDDDLQAEGWCWDAPTRRVYMTFDLLRGGRTWVARDPWWTRSSGGPKYLRPPQAPGAGLFGFNPRKVVITEDLLSARRIYEVTGVSTVPLMGTSLSREDAMHIQQKWPSVFLWLDPDSAGGTGQMAVRKVLSSFDLRISAFDRFAPTLDKRDPKKLSAETISRVLEDFIHE